MKHPHFSQTNKGFTLIETLIAILILSLAIGALLTLTAGGFFTIRYAKNDIVATNLLQESLEYIRNTRDTASIREVTWNEWIRMYQDNGCFADGCTINPYRVGATIDPEVAVTECVTTCENIEYFPEVGYYAYSSMGDNIFDGPGNATNKVVTSFVRTVTMRFETTPSNPDPQLVITARMDWLNGTNPKHAEQSIVMTKWNLQ